MVIPTFPARATVTFTVTATVTATSGTVKNLASVTPPAGATNPGTSCTTVGDPNSRDFAANVCTAGDLDNVTPQTDLLIGKTDGVSAVNANGSTTYTVVVTNRSVAGGRGDRRGPGGGGAEQDRRGVPGRHQWGAVSGVDDHRAAGGGGG